MSKTRYGTAKLDGHMDNDGIVADDLLDDLFHGCAWQAYLQIWGETGQFPPDSEATRRLAYRLYEEALAEKNRRKGQP